MAQMRIVAPARGMPRELKTISSLRDPCACAGVIRPDHACSAITRSAHKNPTAIFDRIIRFPFKFGSALHALIIVLQQLAGGDGELHYVGGYARGIRACGNLGASAVECFQFPVV